MEKIRKFTHWIRGEEVIHFIDENFPLDNSHSVLDIGSYFGYIAKMINDRYGCSVTCSDVSKNIKVDLPFIYIDGISERILTSKKFDLGIMSDVLHHIPFGQQELLISEAMRVCKYLLIVETEDSAIVRLTHKIGKAEGMTNDASEESFFRSKEGWERFLMVKARKSRKRFYYPLKHYYMLIEVQKDGIQTKN
jgi:SAM-dependent methyltransferase